MTQIIDKNLKKNDWYIVILCDNCAKIDNRPAHITKSFIEANIITGFCKQCDGIQIVNISDKAKSMDDWIWKGISQ